MVGKWGSALVAAAAYYPYERHDTMKLLIEAGADVNAQLQTGEYGTALIAAAIASIGHVWQLLENGADPNTMALVGQWGSALVAAAQQRQVESVELLIVAGADVNARMQQGEFRSALHAAVRMEVAYEYETEAELKGTILRRLIDAGADLDAETEDVRHEIEACLGGAVRTVGEATSED
ncbi:ankyrin repeat-containing domain protein [Lineolata rhizophorae]|uniref:Ankyrin repeat-containing domain protein n=1 Tax=Lineolata rhizophorae TaxID=578093 RepID=A0A6A6NMF8_9PEZI|nr:ankyrin repeat-containing domain protein [Lineolata rhizophorae]